MNDNPSDIRSIEEIKDDIMSIDLSLILDKMENLQGWSHEDVKEADKLYRNYLFLLAKYPDKFLPPSEDIDEVWHNHILDTKKYREDCKKIFGKYLDHSPSYFRDYPEKEVKKLEESFTETRYLYQKEFGIPLYQIRNNLKKVVAQIKILFGSKTKQREGLKFKSVV